MVIEDLPIETKVGSRLFDDGGAFTAGRSHDWSPVLKLAKGARPATLVQTFGGPRCVLLAEPGGGSETRTIHWSDSRS